MTEQELRYEFRRIADWMYSVQMVNEDDAVELCQAYAAAQVAAKDAEIAELKAESKYWHDRWEAQNQSIDAEFTSIIDDHFKMKRLKAENERMQNALLDIESDANAKNACGLPLPVKETLHSARHGLAILSPAPVTEDKFSVEAYPKECSPTLDQLTENDNLTMMQRLEKRMPPFHKIDSPKNEDQK